VIEVGLVSLSYWEGKWNGSIIVNERNVICPGNSLSLKEQGSIHLLNELE
jgi:hypothetical protein